MLNQDNIVLLASYPRSGNTFARVVFETMYGLPSNSRYIEPETFLGGSPKPMNPQQPVHLIKTHSKNDAYRLHAKAIYLVRDGRDAIVSHAHFHKGKTNDDRPVEEIMQRLIAGRVPSYDANEYWFHWGKHVKAWLTRPAPTALIRFREFIENPRELMTMAMTGLGFDLPDTGAPIPTFEQLREENEGFFRRGEVGSHQDEMPEALQYLFWKEHGEGMAMAGYETEKAAA